MAPAMTMINYPFPPPFPRFPFPFTTGGMSREELLETNERLRAVRLRLEESYDTAKKALVTLMNKYGDSKSHRNIFHRYPMLKLMIKVIFVLENRFTSTHTHPLGTACKSYTKKINIVTEIKMTNQEINHSKKHLR